MKILVLDTETGGLDSAACGLTELSGLVVSYDNDWSLEVLQESSQLIKPDPRLAYSKEALDMQGRTYEQLAAEGRPIGHVFNDFRKMVCDHFGEPKKCAPFAHNAAFDKSFIEAACCRYGLQPLTNYCYRCSMDLFRWMQTMGFHDCYRASLDVVCDHYQIAISDETRHTAIGDVYLTAYAIGQMMRSLTEGRKP